MIDPTRYPHLSRIQVPADLRQFGEDALPAIADELRAYLIESVGKSGGHFGAGLGVIELTVALHWLYDTPDDRIVWDVGHQTYPHKILTGRRDSIHTVKQKDGVAPFPKREDVKDLFLFQCYTGLAYSDMAKLTDKDISTGVDGGKWIIIRRKKTDVRSAIPLLPMALDILSVSTP